MRVHCTVPGLRPGTPVHPHAMRVPTPFEGVVRRVGVVGVLVCELDSVSVVIATGKRPVPFRTRKLSLSAPMVLPG